MTDRSNSGILPIGIPVAAADELRETLVDTLGCRVERLVSFGHASPPGFWYDQPRNEWAVLVRGAARVRFRDRVVEMKQGDFVNIAAHEQHRVDWTAPDEATIWLAVFYD